MNNLADLNLIIVVSVILFYLYSILNLALIVLDRKDIGSLPFACLIVITAAIFFYLIDNINNLFYLYCAFFGVLFFAFAFLMEKKTLFDTLFLVGSAMINLMATQSIIVSLYAWYCDLTFYTAMQTPTNYSVPLLIVFLVLGAVSNFIHQYLGQEKLIEIFRQKVQRSFLFAWFIAIDIYFLYNARMYSFENASDIYQVNQFVTSIAFSFSFFYMLVYALQNCNMVEVINKNIYYQAELINQQKIVGNLIQNASVQLEVNLNQNKVLSGNGAYEDVLIHFDYDYTRSFQAVTRKMVHPEDQERFLKVLAIDYLLSIFARGITLETIDILRRNTLDEGAYRWYRCTFSLLRDELSDDVKVIIYTQDIDDEKRQQQELTLKAQNDALSGLHNKEHTQQLIKQHLKTGAGVLFIIDIDNFKAINDSMGHGVGDKVLCSLSSELKNLFREGDVLGRIGGDEFMAYIPNALGQELIEMKAKQIINIFYNIYTDAHGRDHIISSSVGIYVVDDELCTFEDAYRKADIAMYQTKKSGKNSYTIYTDGDFYSL